jgi:uncharacterized repeat protein (TIGR04138 family)
MPSQPEKTLEQVLREDRRYPPEAFAFLRDGLNRAVKDAYGEDVKSPPPGQRHVSGQQLCQSLRALAIERWGHLARTVLARWNIRASVDFGQMVYLMIQHGFMRKTEQDSLEDFRNVYDFDEAFRPSDELELKE